MDADLSPILEKSKEFEYLVATHDPVYNDMVAAIELIKEFIIENKLIIYGGSAIDYALRLKGDKIYPDDLLAIPDLDFYSPQNVEHSYQLADLLYARGFHNARAINAQHMETMRVDLTDNHFIADITFRPKVVFDQLPYLVYNGMRVIHPDFQRIDVHSSLSFPFDNPPREVIFERWSKDIKRFNRLAALYPISAGKESIALREVSTRGVRKYVLSGFAAYAVIYGEFLREMEKLGNDIPKDVIPARLAIDGDAITFNTLDQLCEIVHFNSKKAAVELGAAKIKYFEPYVNLLPARIECVKDGSPLTIYSTKNRLISINSVEVGGARLRVTNIQFLLKHFLSMYFAKKSTPKLANVYLLHYSSLISMIGAVSAHVKNLPTESIILPSVQPYGNENINLAREVALSRLYSELEGVPKLRTPQNYYPGKAHAKGTGPPSFNEDDIKFFHESGREVSADDYQDIYDG